MHITLKPLNNGYCCVAISGIDLIQFGYGFLIWSATSILWRACNVFLCEMRERWREWGRGFKEVTTCTLSSLIHCLPQSLSVLWRQFFEPITWAINTMRLITLYWNSLQQTGSKTISLCYKAFFLQFMSFQIISSSCGTQK